MKSIRYTLKMLAFVVFALATWAQDKSSCNGGKPRADDPCQAALGTHLGFLQEEFNIKFLQLSLIQSQTPVLECRVPENPSIEDISEGIHCIQSAFNEYSYPEPIQNGLICDDASLPCNQPGAEQLNTKEKSAVLMVSPSVGRVELKIRQPVTSDQIVPGEPPAIHYLWSTGFLVARDVVATTCHAVESLLVEKHGEWQLKKEPGQDLIIDFEEDTADYTPNQSYQNDKEFEIINVLGYPKEHGLDVILLQVSQTSVSGQKPLPGYLTLSPSEPQSGNEIVLTGYPDMYHPVDPSTTSQTSYGYYKDTDYAKFAVIGNMTTVSKCSKFKVLLHTASTMVGESGSVILLRSDLDPSLGQPKVFGLHTCCALGSQEYVEPPQTKMPCGDLKNTVANQAISSSSILEDPDLCVVLASRGVTCTPHKHRASD